VNIPIGTYNSSYGEQELVIDSFNHTFVDGVSGVGKSTLLEDVAIQNVRAGQGILFIDPHGASIRRILRHIPARYSERVIYVNPLAKKVPGISVFSGTTDEEKELDIVSLISIMKSLAGDAWGHETERIITGAATAAVEAVDQPTMPHVYLFIARELYRRGLLENSLNPVLQDFHNQYDEQLRPSERMSKFSPAYNKTEPFVRPIIRTIFGQTQSLPLVDLMNRQAIILVDLNKGKIGDVNAALIGSAILNHVGIYAFRRKSEKRQPFTIVVDEFQTFGHGINWMTFFAELRKYDIRCWLATQSVTQVPEKWMDSILGNVNNLVCYAVGAKDAERIAQEYGDPALAKALIWLSDHEFFAKVKRGTDRHLYSHVKAFPPLEPRGDESYWKDVLKTSRMRWGKNRKDVDAGIVKLLNWRN
jgi:hypothetical protein